MSQLKNLSKMLGDTGVGTLGERVAKLRKEREARLRAEREALMVLDPEAWLFDNTVSDARTYLGDSDEETAA